MLSQQLFPRAILPEYQVFSQGKEARHKSNENSFPPLRAPPHFGTMKIVSNINDFQRTDRSYPQGYTDTNGGRVRCQAVITTRTSNRSGRGHRKNRVGHLCLVLEILVPGRGKTRTHCGGNNADASMFPKCRFATRATFVADTKIFLKTFLKTDRQHRRTRCCRHYVSSFCGDLR